MSRGAYNSFGVNEAPFNGTVVELTHSAVVAGAVEALADAKAVVVSAASFVGAGVSNAAIRVATASTAVIAGAQAVNNAAKLTVVAISDLVGTIEDAVSHLSVSTTSAERVGLALMSFATAHILRADVAAASAYATLGTAGSKATLARVSNTSSLAASGSAAGLSNSGVYADLEQTREL